MKIRDFFNQFNEEQGYSSHFLKWCLAQGLICKEVEDRDRFGPENKSSFQCKVRKFKTAIRNATAIENSKLPYTYWFMTMSMMTRSKKTLPALEPGRDRLNPKSQPVWAVMQKVRQVVGTPVETQSIINHFESDEPFVDIKNSLRRHSAKPGRGAKKTATMLTRLLTTENLKANTAWNAPANRHEPDAFVYRDSSCY